jgi:murein DD-endopeptidase MepM/ murein hydrolase activator NlpD
MNIYISPSNFVINPVIECDNFCISDFLLREIRFVNDVEEQIEIFEFVFELFAENKPIKKIVYSDVSLLLSKGEKIIRNEHFYIKNILPVDMLEIKVYFKQNGDEKAEALTVPVVNYKTKNEYIFPVKGGGWQVNGNYDCLGAHRIPAPASMEFSIDLGMLNSDNKYEWNDSMKNEDALCYGQEIIAIGDGEVVDCYNTADWRAFWSDDPESDWVKILNQFGTIPLHCGNYVTIKHANDEYSFYGHMIKGSVTVQKGMRVKQGDVLGKLGNVGFSGAPHLHFHLMDGPDSFGEAKGLPCHFTNIIDMCGRPLSLIQEEYTIVMIK